MQTPQDPTPVPAAVVALLHRARTGMLFNVATRSPHTEQFNFWQGYAKALNDLTSGVGDALAAKDFALQGYQGPSMLAAAASCLDIDIYCLSRAAVVQRLAQAGIEVASDEVANTDIGTARQLENSAVAAINLHSEHSAHLVDVNDDSVVHVAPLIVFGVDIQPNGIVTRVHAA